MKLLAILLLVCIAIIGAAEVKRARIPSAEITNNAGYSGKQAAEQLLSLLTTNIGAFEKDLMAPDRFQKLEGSEYSVEHGCNVCYFTFDKVLIHRDEKICRIVLTARTFVFNEQLLFTVNIQYSLRKNRKKGIRYYKTNSIKLTADKYQVAAAPVYDIRSQENNLEAAMIFGFKNEPSGIRLAIFDTLGAQGVFLRDDGPAILKGMGKAKYPIDGLTSMHLDKVTMDTTRDGHRTCFTSTQVTMQTADETNLYQLNITFQHQEDPNEESYIPRVLRYRPTLIALKRLQN